MRVTLAFTALLAAACSSTVEPTRAAGSAPTTDATVPSTGGRVDERDASAESEDAKLRPPHCIDYEGVEYCAPFVFEGSSEAVSVAGLGDIEAVEQLLPPTLKPVTVSGEAFPRALVSLSAINYLDSKIGTYQEFVVQLLAQDRGPTEVYYESLPAFFGGISSGDATVQHGFYVLHLTLDGPASEVAIELGREFGRFPKFAGSVVLDETAWPNPAFRVEQPAGDAPAFSVEVALWGTTFAPVWINSTTSFDISTAGTEQPCWMQTEANGEVASEFFDLNDRVEASGWLGDLLGDIAFVPTGWAINRSHGSLRLDGLSAECWAPEE